ncbi:DUF262 domain-containing protein [Gilliamella apicola]|jgi:Protein of unknown function DUF262.|uniref:DUF262 domain-containing protein n=1 Tax=Gilliamella apicola TaxID=1196095 RepID=UPI002FEE2405
MKLLPKEHLDLSREKSLTNIAFDPNLANEKYKKGEVRIVTEQARYPLNTIVGLVQSDNYILNPEFQRRHRWDNARKSRLIESFIMNVPIPPIFLYEVDYSVYEVMDGLQRLTAISQFYQDKYSLESLVEWQELNGLTYSKLPEQIRKGIDRRYISSIILLQETAKSENEANRLKQVVFERINSGGEKLKPQEIRNALYPGKLNSLTIKLARNSYFCKLWDIPEQSTEEKETGQPEQNVIDDKYFKDMSDAELVLRFFAYRQLDKWQGNTLENFLDEYLKEGNANFDETVLNGLTKIFEDTIQFAYELFDKKAFWLHRNRENNWFHYERPTKILYDPLMQVLTRFLDKKNILLFKKNDILQGLKDLHQQEYEIFKGRDTNKTKVQERIKILTSYLQSFIDG